MKHPETPPQAAHDLLLVLGVAALALGFLLVSQGLLANPPAHKVQRERAALLPAESAVLAPGERLAAITSPRDSVPPMPGTSTAISDASLGVATCFPHGVVACPPRLDLDHDLRLVLTAMALHKRRIPGERPAGYYGTPANQDVPAKVRALAGAATSVAHVDIPPPSARRLNAPGS